MCLLTSKSDIAHPFISSFDWFALQAQATFDRLRQRTKFKQSDRLIRLGINLRFIVRTKYTT